MKSFFLLLLLLFFVFCFGVLILSPKDPRRRRNADVLLHPLVLVYFYRAFANCHSCVCSVYNYAIYEFRQYY